MTNCHELKGEGEGEGEERERERERRGKGRGREVDHFETSPRFWSFLSFFDDLLKVSWPYNIIRSSKK